MHRPGMLCEAVRGGERIVGWAGVVAERIGAKTDSVYEGIRRRRPVFGWTVRRIGSIETRTQYAAYHVSDTERQDPVTGDAWEVAEVIGISNASYVSALAHMNRVTKNGYSVEALPEEEQWQISISTR